jgi:alkylation response protein AidB-like acyl-CoA dehydrogenase
MDFQLESVTERGASFVELAEKHAVEFAPGADRHDRDGTFPTEQWDALGRSGFLAATVPADLGGGGVATVADLVAGIGRLARGHPAVAIGAAMHSTALWYFARRYAGPGGPPDDDVRARIRLLLRACVRRPVVACVALSERGGSIARPRTAATPDGDGYRLEGRKSFCTNSPAATLFLVSVRVAAPAGPDRFGFAVVGRDTAGLAVLENWDALGMRASGSGDVVLDGCRVPRASVLDVGALGTLPAAVLPLTMVGALLLAAAFLGVAEQAQSAAVDGARRAPPSGAPPRSARGTVQTLVAENEVELAGSRALLARAAAVLDDRLPTLEAEAGQRVLDGLMKEVQCASLGTRRSAVAVVDRALTISGGAGYLSSDLLSRLYRDVRAGPFMQPFSALDAYEYIGRVRLGLDAFASG